MATWRLVWLAFGHATRVWGDCIIVFGVEVLTWHVRGKGQRGFPSSALFDAVLIHAFVGLSSSLLLSGVERLLKKGEKGIEFALDRRQLNQIKGFVFGTFCRFLQNACAQSQQHQKLRRVRHGPICRDLQRKEHC